MTLGFNGISNSTSTLNKSVINMLHRYGYASKSHWTKYLGGTPVADSLIGIKYVISSGKTENQVLRELFYDSEHDYYIYENPYALSLAFAANASAAELEITDYDSPLELMNALTAAIAGLDDVELFSRAELISTDFNNIDTGFTSKHRKYSKKNENSSATIEYTVKVPAGKPIYMSIPTDYPRECNLKVDGVSKGTCMGNETDRVIYLGIFDTEREITVTLELKDDPIYIMTGQHYFYSFNSDLFKSIYNGLASGNMEITHFDDTHIEGNVNVSDGNTLLYTSIVYDEGWQVTVDGENVELIKTNDSLLAVDITPGEHTVTFTYLPKCYTVGSAVSVAGLVAFAGAIVIDEIRKRRELRQWAAQNNIF